MERTPAPRGAWPVHRGRLRNPALTFRGSGAASVVCGHPAAPAGGGGLREGSPLSRGWAPARPVRSASGGRGEGRRPRCFLRHGATGRAAALSGRRPPGGPRAGGAGPRPRRREEACSPAAGGAGRPARPLPPAPSAAVARRGLFRCPVPSWSPAPLNPAAPPALRRACSAPLPALRPPRSVGLGAWRGRHLLASGRRPRARCAGAGRKWMPASGWVAGDGGGVHLTGSRGSGGVAGGQFTRELQRIRREVIFHRTMGELPARE